MRLWLLAALLAACHACDNTNSSDLCIPRNLGSVKLSGDGRRLALGAPGHEAENGLAALLEYDEFGENWTINIDHVRLPSTGTGTGNKFGSEVSLSTDGDTLCTGAHLMNNYTSGAWCFIYHDMSRHVELQSDLMGESANAACGDGLALSADARTLVLGCPRANSATGGVTIVT